MLSLLKRHPFAVEAFFESSLVLTYAVHKETVQMLIPECLTLDTWQDEWAFVAVAIVQTRHLRPKGFPKCLGNRFILVGYRLFVQYITNQGKRLRGLYILKSETDQQKMAILGNLFTHYRYTTTDIDYTQDATLITVQSQKSGLHIIVDTQQSDAISLPAQSPFDNWKQARRFAGPLPFTFTYQPESKQVLIIEGLRENWTPQPVAVLKSEIGFMQQTNYQAGILASAFVVQNIPYCWKKGRIELWNRPTDSLTKG